MRLHTKQTASAVIVGLGILLAGCGTKLNYKPPVTPQITHAEKWSTPLEGGEVAQPANDETLAHWWSMLSDPVLTALEERAVKGNLDLRKAEAAVRQARAQRNAQQTQRLPTVTAGGSGSYGRVNASLAGQNSQSYSLNVMASWEPDFFHAIRNTIAAYDADLQASQESLRNTLVSLTAEVALNYVDVRSYQSQIAITQENLKSQQSTYELTVARYETGLATQLDAEQARQTMESTRSTLPTMEANLQAAANNIAVLLGEAPGAVNAELAAVKPVPTVPVEVAVGVPADLIRRRPDIRNAERQVASQTALLKVAQANLYPSFTLTGNLGLNSPSITDLLTPESFVANAALAVQQVVFNRRRIHEQINAQDAVLDQSLATYEKTVISAMQDVEDALKAFAAEQVRRKSLAEATTAAERSASMSRELYAAGLKDFLTVLDSQRSLLILQNQLAQSDATITSNLIRLYKALGGGWS
jgi:outer membrane protein, multidrug efflux system